MADVVRIRLLGGFQVAAGDQAVDPRAWRLRKAKTLVKLLALQPTRRLHRDRLADALWPGLGPDAARNNLHQVLHAARKAFATVGVHGAGVLGLQDDVVALGPRREVVTDLEEFEQAVRSARHEGDGGALTAALERWPEDLLPEDVYEPWAQGHLTRFQEWRSAAVMEAVEARLADGDADAAVAMLAPVVSADPLREPAHRAMMRALAAAGRRPEALLVFERLRSALDEELAADPEPSTLALFRELLTAGPGPAPGSPAPEPPGAGRLPAPLTALVGRDRELAETEATLARTRLLTFTGPGGVGKTTLAVELARRRAADYQDGAFLAELGALTDRELVVPQVAGSFGLQLGAQSDPLESLVAQLRRHRALLVLDNCEHLLEECARVTAALLRACPGISVLATSREPLRIQGEIGWRTPSLQLPGRGAANGVAALSAIASVELFVRRATAASPGFALTPENAAPVAEICHRLDGMPLALELAAAYVPALSPQQIADRLSDALSLLRRGDRAAITRQQTLEATLAWSDNLLGDQERRLFRRLAVFAGSFTLAAAESVCGHGSSPSAVLGALARLVDASLVMADARGEPTRYRLLETARQYARERSRAEGEWDEAQRRHCAWYLRFAQDRDPERSADPVDALPASLDVEHDNLRAALAWALSHQPRTALELAVASWPYWLARGHFREGARWLETAVAAVPEPSALRARALDAMAVFDIRRGDGRRLAGLGAEAVAICRRQGEPEGLARALHADAILAYMRGCWTECWERSAQAREVAVSCDAGQLATAAAHLQAVVLMGRGELAAAQAALDGIAAALTRLPPATLPFFPLVALGYAVGGSDSASPRVHFEETVLPGRRVGAEQAAAYVRCDLAALARLAGDLDTALACAHTAVREFASLGDRDGESHALSHLGCLHRARGEFREGRQALSRSLELRRLIGDRRGMGLARANLGVLAAAEGDLDGGIALLELALSGFRETGDAAGRVGLEITMASVHADARAYEPAERRLQESLPGSHHIPGNHRGTAWASLMLADVLRGLGRAADADSAAAQASALFSALGVADAAAGMPVAPRGR